MSSAETICDMCHRIMQPHAHYVVKIEVLANPEMPPVTRDEIDNVDYQAKIRELLEQMKNESPRTLQDAVYRRFEFRICPGCQRRYLENPLPSD